MNSHEFDVRVYYEDTDTGGVVYYANYLKFCERARTEALRTMGFSNSALLSEDNILLVVRHVEADYIASSCLDDLLTIKTITSDVKNVSFVMEQEIIRQNKLIFAAKVTIVCVNENIKPVRLPKKLYSALANN
jgi:acyl-CoA thioester hydrolase